MKISKIQNQSPSDNPEPTNTLVNKELLTMDIFLMTKANRTAITLEQYISIRLAQGVSKDVLQADLLKDLEEGGRIFGEFRNAIRATSNGVINRMRDNAIFGTFGINTQYRWVAILVNTCPDCLERHNQVQPWSEWELEGLPRTGATVCMENCKCILAPVAETSVIMRGKK